MRCRYISPLPRFISAPSEPLLKKFMQLPIKTIQVAYNQGLICAQ